MGPANPSILIMAQRAGATEEEGCVVQPLVVSKPSAYVPSCSAQPQLPSTLCQEELEGNSDRNTRQDGPPDPKPETLTWTEP